MNDEPFETVTPSKRKKVSVITWNGDKSFTGIANIYSAADNTELEFTYTDTWSMEDGKFIMQRKAQNFVNGEVWSQRQFMTGNKINIFLP